MKVYDISQEVFGCEVFPGDPAPEKQIISSMDEGSLYNLSAIRMCAHNGTHVDAPYHFYNDGKKIDEMPLEAFVGYAYVAEYNGVLTSEDAIEILDRARKASNHVSKRILIKGEATVSLDAAKVFAEAGVLLLGNESQTVGPKEAPMEVHLELLKKEIVLLEGIRLKGVDEGVYILNAAPLKLGGCDGAPCRAILVEID
ncbi:MAG: cyclase family protein [Lachnospiraceae bacterium]|nr:cyclase family protein [Lachnospiraceae bacterium]